MTVERPELPEPEPEELDWKPQPRSRALVTVLRCARCRTPMSVVRISDVCGRCQLDDLRASGYLPS